MSITPAGDVHEYRPIGLSVNNLQSALLSGELRAVRGLGTQYSDWDSALALATACDVLLSHLDQEYAGGKLQTSGASSHACMTTLAKLK